MKNTVLGTVTVRKENNLFILQGASKESWYERLQVNHNFDSTICEDIGWCLNCRCKMVKVTDRTYEVICYEL